MRRDVVGVLQGTYQVSELRACSAMVFGRSSHRYRSRRDPQVALRMRLKDLGSPALAVQSWWPFLGRVST